jgi:hypothetical protein
MPNALPMLFIALAASALLLTLLWLWQSLRLAFVHVVTDEAPAAPVSAERSTLLAEKKALLLALKDLEAERDAGKLSQEDFVELNDQYRTRARNALRQLDALLAPHRAEAKALLVRAADGGGGLVRAADGGGRAADGGAKASATPATQAAAPGACPDCKTLNDLDAVFCKKCGTRLGPGPQA